MTAGSAYFCEDKEAGATLPSLGSNLAGTAGLYLQRPSARQPVPQVACKRVNLNGELRT